MRMEGGLSLWSHSVLMNIKIHRDLVGNQGNGGGYCHLGRKSELRSPGCSGAGMISLRSEEATRNTGIKLEKWVIM